MRLVAILLSTGLLFGSATVAHAESALRLGFNESGLSSLNYTGTEFLAYGDFRMREVAFIRSDGKTFAGNTTSRVMVDAAAHRQIRAYDWGTVTAEYFASGNILGVKIGIHNRSEFAMESLWCEPLALHFPAAIREFARGWPLVTNTIGQPAIQSMSFRSGTIILAADDVTKPLQLGFPWAVDSPTNRIFPLMLNTGRVRTYPDSYPMIRRAIPAGGSDEFSFSLRFGPPDSTALTLARDVYQKFAKAYPATLAWEDRRAIGSLFLSTSARNWPTNPRGWLLDPHIDVLTAEGLAAFRQRILQFADTSIAILKGMNAQGMITWDIEGQQYPHSISYVGDPTKIATVAPEMNSIADAYFARFRAARLRVGVCVRPQQFMVASDGRSARQDWIADPTELLIEKIRYAHDRWGATLFYVDSNVRSFADQNPIDPAIFKRLQATFPDSLFIPEHWVAEYWAYSAPYEELRKGFTGTAPEIRLMYPNALTLINTADGEIEQNLSALAGAAKQGDVLMYRSWFLDPANSLVRGIYETIGSSIAP